MKKLLSAAVIALLSSNASAFSWGPFDAPWLLRDPVNKISHMVVAAPAAYVITEETGCPWVGIGAMTLFGIIQELTDVNYSKPDLYSWMAGGVLGAGLSYYMKDKPQCGKTPTQTLSYESLGTGSKILNGAILLGANPYVAIGAGIIGSAAHYEYYAKDVPISEEWPYKIQTSSFNKYMSSSPTATWIETN